MLTGCVARRPCVCQEHGRPRTVAVELASCRMVAPGSDVQKPAPGR